MSYTLHSFLLLSILLMLSLSCSSPDESTSSVSNRTPNEGNLPQTEDHSNPDSPSSTDDHSDLMPDSPSPIPRSGIAVLGYSSHSLEEVQWDIIGTEEDGLSRPTALQVNPARPDELWVVNNEDGTVVVFFDYQTSERRSRKFTDPYSIHFMPSPSSIAFDPFGQFATCQDSRNGGDDFMGPTLWTSDFDIFAQSNPEAVAYLSEDLGSHLDMLHESPQCMGIAWRKENQYWVFEGQSSSLALVDFREDHGPGFDDHSDGVITRFALGEVARFPRVPSHLVYDASNERLYVADTGNQRIAVIDVSNIDNLSETTDHREALLVKELGTQLWLLDEPSTSTLTGTQDRFRGPSGLALHEGVLYVADTASGIISALDPESGEVLDWLDTEITSPGLMGITFDLEGNLYITDGQNHQIIRISPKRD